MYVIRKISTPKPNPNTVKSRCFKNFIPENFQNDLLATPWHIVELEENPGNCCNKCSQALSIIMHH